MPRGKKRRKKLTKVLGKKAPGVITKDAATDWENFTQAVITVKVNERLKALRNSEMLK